MSAQLKADLADARKRLKQITAHRDRLRDQGLTADRWLEARHDAASKEVAKLAAQIASQRSGFAGQFA